MEHHACEDGVYLPLTINGWLNIIMYGPMALLGASLVAVDIAAYLDPVKNSV